MLYIIVMLIVFGATVAFACIFNRKGNSIAGIGLVLALVFTAWSSVVVVDNGYVGVEKRFGSTLPTAYGPGLHILPPWADVTYYNVLRREFPIQGVVVSADNNPLTVNVGFATKLNPAYAWRMQVTVGEAYFDTLVKTAAQTAVRDAVAGFPWAKAAVSDRGEVHGAIQRNFERIVAEQLESAGLSSEEARASISFSPAQLRAAIPDPKVLNAVAERSAALEDLERQKTLTLISDQEALRRKSEGLGVSNLFRELPQGFTSSEIAEVLGALANKTRADAMLKAVESGSVNSIIFNGDTASGVATPLPQPKAKPTTPGKATDH